MSSLVDTSQRITDGELPQNASFETLCSYVPVSIVDYLARCQREGTLPAPPFKHTWETAVIFADVSGFTKLSEQLAAKGPSGAEELATKLNKYFQLLVRTIAKEGGDIFKFAGDAVLIIWPVLGEGPKDEDNEERLTTLTRRAVQCANEVQQVLHGYDLSGDDEVVEKQNSKEKVRSVLKLGVGVGKVSVMHVGGLLARMEYIATGQPLIDAFEAESRASPGDVVVSPKALSLVEKGFGFEFNVENGFGFVRDFDPRKKLKRVSVAAKHQLAPSEPTLFRRIQQYIPGAVLPFLNEQEHWASELRRITVMFVNLGFTPKQMDGAAEAIQQVMSAVNEAIYSYEGALNKFLMDDKGSTLIAVFGLRPLAHADDAIRGVLTSLLLCSKLDDLGYHASVGIATGVAFCGIVGRQHLRREYSVLGDIVNLSARLMSFASKNGGGVLCCKQTYIRACDRLSFEGPRKITVKGKANLVKIYAPRCSTGSNPLINEGYARTAFRSGLFAANYELQLQHYASHHHVKLELSRSRGKISRRLLEPRSRSAAGSRNLSDIGEPFESFMLDDTSRVNGVIVTLPSGQRVSFACTELSTIYQLKERLFEIIRENKGLVDGFVSSPSEYMFTVPREQTVLFDESMSLTKLDEQAPIVELDLKRWRHHRDLDGDHLKAHRQTLSNAVASLFNDDEEQGPTIIIEGDMGLGKTTLLTYVICSARVPVICVAGNPFEMNKQLAVFRMPFLQLIDSICADKFGRDAKPYEAHHREDVVVCLLGHHGDMSELLPLLNDFISLQFITNERCQRMDDEERLANLIKLLTGLMLQFCETGPLVCAVDDLIYLDRSSWNLILSLHRHGRRLLLLMATEPMKRSYLAALSTAVPEQYRQLCRSERTVKIVLEPFPEETITKILREKDVLSNSVIPKRLSKALVKRSLGNPVICRELVWSLKTAELISMRKQSHAGRRHRKGSSETHSSRSHVELAPNFTEQALDTVPVSPYMQDILGCRMGRLSNIQQMILKTASIIGNQFDFEILCLAYPIEKHLPKLESEFQRLVSNGVVHLVETKPPKKKKKNSLSEVYGNPQRRTYEFSIGMMQNVARSRLLDKQATDLKESTDKADCLAFGEKRLENYVYFLQPSADDRNKPIDCLKNSKWKMRWAEITEDRLILYHNKRTHIVDRVIMLDKATVSLDEKKDDAAMKKSTSFKKMRHASIFRSSKDISHSGSDDTVRRDFFFRLTCKKAEHHPEPTPSVVNCSPIKKSFPSTLTRLSMRKHGGAPSPSNSGGSSGGFGTALISPRNSAGIGRVENVVPPSPRHKSLASPSNGGVDATSSSSTACTGPGISSAHLRQLEFVASAGPRGTGAGLRGSGNTAPHTVFQRVVPTPELRKQYGNGIASAPITMAGSEDNTSEDERSLKSSPTSPSVKNHLDKHAHHASAKNGHEGPMRGRARSRDNPERETEPLSSDCVHPISLRSRKGRHITLPPESEDHSSRRSTRSTSPKHTRGGAPEPKRPRSKSPSLIASSNKNQSKRKIQQLQPAMTLPPPDTQRRASGLEGSMSNGVSSATRVTVRQGPRSLSRTGLRRAKTAVGLSPPFSEMRVENHPQEFIFSCPTENDRRAWSRSIKRAILELTNASHEQQKSLKSQLKDDVWMPFDRSTIMPPPLDFNCGEDHKGADEMETLEDETRFFEDFLASRADHTPAKDSLAAIREALSYTLSEQLSKDDPALYESSGNSDSDLLSPHSQRSASATPQPHDDKSNMHPASIDISGREFKSSASTSSGDSNFSNSTSYHVVVNNHIKQSPATPQNDVHHNDQRGLGERAFSAPAPSARGVPGSPTLGPHGHMHRQHSRSNVTQVSLSVGEQSTPSVSFTDHRRQSSISSGGSSAQLSDLEEGSRTPSVHSVRSVQSATSSRPTSPQQLAYKRPTGGGGPVSPTGSLSSRTSQSHVAHLGNRSPSTHALSSSMSIPFPSPTKHLSPRPHSPLNNHRKMHRSTSPEFGPDSPHDNTTLHTRQLSTGSTASVRSTRSTRSIQSNKRGHGNGTRSNQASPRHGPRSGPSPPASPTPVRVGRQSPANTIESSVSFSAQRSRSPNKRRKTLSRGGMLVRYWNAPAQTSVRLQAEAHPLRAGLLHIKKSNISGLTKPLTQAWKRRFAVLTDDSLIFFKSNKKGAPTESLCLISAVVRLDRHEVFRRNQNKSRRSWRRTVSPDGRRSHRHATSNGVGGRSSTPTGVAASNGKTTAPSSNGLSVGRSGGGGFFSMRGGGGRRTSNSSTASESSVASEKANGSEFSRSRGGILSGGHGGSGSGANTPSASGDGSGGSSTSSLTAGGGSGGSLSDSASVFLVQCSLWVKRGELHREKRSVAIAAEPDDVLEWVKALRHVTDKHRQFLHENPMFREDIGVNGLADPDPPESQISTRGRKSPSGQSRHHGKTNSKSGSGADSETSGGTSPTATRQSNPSDLIDYALDLLNMNGLSQIEMEEILRHLRRVYLQRQSALTAPISQEDGESIASLLHRSDLDKDTKKWLREYTRPDAAYHEPKKSSLELVGSPVSGIGTSVHDFKDFLLSPPPASSCDIKHLSNVFAEPMSKDAIRSLELWHFNVFQVGVEGPTSLFPSVVKMFERFDVFDRFHISPMAFVTFLNDVKDAYYDNPYHNFYHGVDVCQTIFSTLTSLGVGEHFSTLEKFALLLAALLHDLRHPGYNNTFQVNAMTQLAVFYNDQSVLENHHCASAFGIFRNHELLQGLSKEEYRTLRKIVISAILATDMTCHFELLRKFNSRIEADWKSTDGPPPSPSHARSATLDNKVPKYNSADRELIMNVLLHGADISNPAKDWVVAKDWSNRIQEESLLQGDAERRNGLPVSPNCDRATVNRPQFSLNFIDFIVAPMFVSLTQFVPKMYMGCKKLRENRAEWAHLMVESIQSSDMDSQHKADEFKKWDRRTKGFNLVMVPEERHNPPDAPPNKHRKDSIQVSQMIGTMLNASQRDIRVPKTLPKMRTHTAGVARAKTARPRAKPASFRRNSTPQPSTPSSKSPSPAPANTTSSDEA